jgi:hypothetical protein
VSESDLAARRRYLLRLVFTRNQFTERQIVLAFGEQYGTGGETVAGARTIKSLLAELCDAGILTRSGGVYSVVEVRQAATA